jgi:hypothetical protein
MLSHILSISSLPSNQIGEGLARSLPAFHKFPTEHNHGCSCTLPVSIEPLLTDTELFEKALLHRERIFDAESSIAFR